jgi:hypothetical protein
VLGVTALRRLLRSALQHDHQITKPLPLYDDVAAHHRGGSFRIAGQDGINDGLVLGE